MGYDVVDLDSKLKELYGRVVEDLESQICDIDNFKFIPIVGEMVESSVREMLTSDDVFLSYRRDTDNLNTRDSNDRSRSVIVYIEPRGRNYFIMGDSVNLRIGVLLRNHVIGYRIKRMYNFSAELKEYGGFRNE